MPPQELCPCYITYRSSVSSCLACAPPVRSVFTIYIGLRSPSRCPFPIFPTAYRIRLTFTSIHAMFSRLALAILAPLATTFTQDVHCTTIGNGDFNSGESPLIVKRAPPMGQSGCAFVEFPKAQEGQFQMQVLLSHGNGGWDCDPFWEDNERLFKHLLQTCGADEKNSMLSLYPASFHPKSCKMNIDTNTRKSVDCIVQFLTCPHDLWENGRFPGNGCVSSDTLYIALI